MRALDHNALFDVHCTFVSTVVEVHPQCQVPTPLSHPLPHFTCFPTHRTALLDVSYSTPVSTVSD